MEIKLFEALKQIFYILRQIITAFPLRCRKIYFVRNEH